MRTITEGKTLIKGKGGRKEGKKGRNRGMGKLKENGNVRKLRKRREFKK